jgi:hypothetical protein
MSLKATLTIPYFCFAFLSAFLCILCGKKIRNGGASYKNEKSPRISKLLRNFLPFALRSFAFFAVKKSAKGGASCKSEKSPRVSKLF